MARKETRTDVSRRKFLAGAAVATTAATMTNSAQGASPGAVTNKRHHRALRIREFRGDRVRNGGAHRGETAG